MRKTNRESAHSQTFGLLSASGFLPSLESRPSGSQNRICFSSLSQACYAVLLIPSSGPFGQILSPPRRLFFKNYMVFGKRMKNHYVW